jgi:hypothetical protein
MARARRSATNDMNLTVGVHTRVSEEAWALILRAAKGKGLLPATWIRVTLYKELGIIGADQ